VFLTAAYKPANHPILQQNDMPAYLRRQKMEGNPLLFIPQKMVNPALLPVQQFDTK